MQAQTQIKTQIQAQMQIRIQIQILPPFCATQHFFTRRARLHTSYHTLKSPHRVKKLFSWGEDHLHTLLTVSVSVEEASLNTDCAVQEKLISARSRQRSFPRVSAVCTSPKRSPPSTGCFLHCQCKKHPVLQYTVIHWLGLP